MQESNALAYFYNMQCHLVEFLIYLKEDYRQKLIGNTLNSVEKQTIPTMKTIKRRMH